MTLRELATKTGKSTGVLDQASKKLLSRQILIREKINGVPKYTVDSVDAIKRWVQKDSKTKRELISRKEQDFQKFIDSLEFDSSRPRMEYFEGSEGVQKAYMKLLDTQEKEMLQFMPMNLKEEEDPLRDFRVQYFRERKRRKIFLRTIGHESPLGRRFQSRDHFEYRKTSLVPESVCPISFEKIIIGNTIACFNHEEGRACFIHYPELAVAEKQFFTIAEQSEVTNTHKDTYTKQGQVPVATKTLSGVRSFFLSKQGLVYLALSALSAVLLTQMLYFYALSIMKIEIGERLLSIATTAAQDFDIVDIEKLQFARDMSSKEYERVFKRLSTIRDSNANIQFVYLLRPTDQRSMWQFIADADSSVDLLQQSIDDPDYIEVIPPGTFYDVSFPETALTGVIPRKPLAESDFLQDEWGSYLSAYAPILDKNEETIAILGLDMNVTDVLRQTVIRFNIWRWFFGLFTLIVAYRLVQLVRRQPNNLK